MMRRMLERIRFMRDHRFTRAHMSDYLDGDLREGERVRVEHHAGLCPECRRLLRSLRETLARLTEMRAPAPEGLAADVIERLRREG